jgi:predicted phosphoribosyltransferase
MFRDRIDAGVKLAAKLQKYREESGVVIAIPRGGVPVAYAVARELNLPLEIILTKKIGHPSNKEYAIGAASLTDYFVIPHPGITDQYIQEELKEIRARLRQMQERYSHDYMPADIKDKIVILIDDGIATGNTILATIKVLNKGNPAKIIVATPVASQSAVDKLVSEVDEVVVVLIPKEFYGVGAFYQDFDQVSDQEVQNYLENLREFRPTG